MKALLVADDEKAINNISEVLKSRNYDVIVYKWLLKALDNIEEIAPHLIVISTKDYPRHWKTLTQYAASGFGDYSPQVILLTDENFGSEEQKKAEVLKVRGTFDSIGVEGLDKLREILTKTDDIFSGIEKKAPSEDRTSLTETNQDFSESKQSKQEENKDISQNTDSNNSLKDEEVENLRAADRLQYLEDNEEVPTVEEIMQSARESDDSFSMPGIDDLKKLLEENEFAESQIDESLTDECQIDEMPAEDNLPDESQIDEMPDESQNDENQIEENISSIAATDKNESTEYFEESESSDIIKESSEEKTTSDSQENQEPNGENTMSDEQSIEDKLAAIMSANKADAKEKAAELNLDEPAGSTSVSFVFTNPITLAMVSGVARNYNGLVLEFTPDIPTFIMNLSPGTKISIASMKIDGKIENVFAEVMSNDAKKLALAIKK